MIDTHAHVHSSAFDRDRGEVLERAFAAGVDCLLEVNIDVARWPAARELMFSDPRIFGTVGIHPHDVARATVAELESMAEWVTHPRIRAIGETGLDYYRDYAPHEIQRDFFTRQVRMAREAKLPLVVHSRQKIGGSAHADVLRILAEEGRGEVRGVLHCFSGDLEVARRAHELGFKLGMGGAITYKPKESGPLIRAIAETIDPDIFVLETDCPYLTPHPKRSDRNEPANIPAIAAALADYLGISTQEIARRTDASARALFALDA